MKLLHFSDIHDNQRAMDAVTRVAARWVDAAVVITGDVCKKYCQASSRWDDLANPHVWLVPGHHDRPTSSRLGNLSRVQWQTPYMADLQYCAVVGLDSEHAKGVKPQLQELNIENPNSNIKSVIVLHHSPYSETVKSNIIAWAKSLFPKIVSIVLLHGHEHHVRGFFAEKSMEQAKNVGSAQKVMLVRQGEPPPGCSGR